MNYNDPLAVEMLRKLQLELATAKQQLDEAKQQLEHALNPVHSCGDTCQRPACVWRRMAGELAQEHVCVRWHTGLINDIKYILHGCARCKALAHYNQLKKGTK
jgi:hypothetical protein